MKTNCCFFKLFSAVMIFSAFSLSTYAQNQGNGIGGNTGASIEHSANVNNNNNGHAGEGNHGNGVGNMPYGNQGSNDNPNGRTGSRGSDSIPLDGGLGILALIAAGFGIKKLRNHQK